MRISDWSSDVCSSDLQFQQAALVLDDNLLVVQRDACRRSAAQVFLKKARGVGAFGASQQGHTSFIKMWKHQLRDRLVVFKQVHLSVVGLGVDHPAGMSRSEERRVGKECVSTCR